MTSGECVLNTMSQDAITQQVMVVPPDKNLNGVKDSVAVKIQEMLAQGRRYFGSAGASLTHHANDPHFQTDFGKSVARAGMEGERDTSQRIRDWMRRHPNAVLLDSVHIRGMSSKDIDRESFEQDGDGPDTDHVLVVGSYVFLIDSKRWKAKKSYRVNDKGVVQRGSKAKGYRSFPGGRVHARQARSLWSRYLHPRAKIFSIVCISNDKVYVVRDKESFRHGFQLTTLDNLTSDLDYRLGKAKEDDVSVIYSDIVAQVAVSCIKPFDAYEKIFGMKLAEITI